MKYDEISLCLCEGDVLVRERSGSGSNGLLGVVFGKSGKNLFSVSLHTLDNVYVYLLFYNKSKERET